MDRKRLRLLLTAAIVLLAIILGMELAAPRPESQPATEPPASTAATTAATTLPAESIAATDAPSFTLPPNMLPIG